MTPNRLNLFDSLFNKNENYPVALSKNEFTLNLDTTNTSLRHYGLNIVL